MTSTVSLRIAQSPTEVEAVKEIFREYMGFIENYLGESLNFQGTEKEFADFPATYDALFLAAINGEPVGACGIKPFKPGICELKRLYCRPNGRGHHLGQKLTEAAITQAREIGYSQMFLDTDPGLTHANAVYEALGFEDIDRYYDNPMGCSRYMALTL
jgi:carbonic anhydrase